MGDQLFDDEWLDDSAVEADAFAATDPFDGLTRRDQDIFFKVLDIIPDDKREIAMDYFLDHPQKIQAVIAGVKMQKKMLADKDVAGLNKLFEQERVLFQNADVVIEAAKDADDNY